MRLSKLRVGVGALVLLGLLSGSEAQVRSKNDKFVDSFLLLQLLQSRKMLSDLSVKTCDSEMPTPCIIEMKLVQFDGRNYCVAVAPDLHVKWNANGGIFNKKIVHWKLSRPDLDGKLLGFHPDSGIVITTDPKGQVDKKGDYGDGGGSSSPDTYHTKTKRDEKDAQTGYLPVILWGSSGNEELCAAIDPKIVNVN